MDLTNYEYGVDKKREGKLKLLTYLLVAAYVAFVGGAFGILYAIRLIPVFAAVPFILLIIIFLTWRYVQVDNKYIMESGKIVFLKIYGAKTQREVTSLMIKAAVLIAPLDKSLDEISEFNPEKVYDALPYIGCEDAYALLYINEKGKKSLLKLQATAQAVKIFRYYNDKTVVCATKC